MLTLNESQLCLGGICSADHEIFAFRLRDSMETVASFSTNWDRYFARPLHAIPFFASTAKWRLSRGLPFKDPYFFFRETRFHCDQIFTLPYFYEWISLSVMEFSAFFRVFVLLSSPILVFRLVYIWLHYRDLEISNLRK